METVLDILVFILNERKQAKAMGIREIMICLKKESNYLGHGSNGTRSILGLADGLIDYSFIIT
jgi:hypothetical protein